MLEVIIGTFIAVSAIITVTTVIILSGRKYQNNDDFSGGIGSQPKENDKIEEEQQN